MEVKRCTSVFSVVLFTLLFLALLPAKADSFSWSWSLSGNGFNGSGTLTSDSAAQCHIFGCGYSVSAMDGQLNGVGLTLKTSDNLLEPAQAGRLYCTSVAPNCIPISGVIPDWRAGLNFTTTDGIVWGLLLNQWASTPLPFTVYDWQGTGKGANVNVSILPAPEPSALALFGLGLISLLGLAAVKRYLPHRLRPVRRKQFQFQS
jgi:hypothetical protein